MTQFRARAQSVGGVRDRPDCRDKKAHPIDRTTMATEKIVQYNDRFARFTQSRRSHASDVARTTCH
jgi:hypothetical protein